MQVLFLFEETIGLEIERNEETTSLVFKNDNPSFSVLMSYLYAWYVQRKSLPDSDDDAGYNARTQYEKWKARFPHDLSSYWEEQHKAVNDFYQPLTTNAMSARTKITQLSEFFLHVRELIKNDLTIKLNTKLYGVGDIALIMTFTISELLDTDNKKRQEAFTTYLCDITDMNEYGMPYYTEMSSDESGTKISYILRWSPLASFKSFIIQMIEHEANISTLSDLEIDSFEKSLTNDLLEYDLDLKEEIAIFTAKR